MKKRYCFFPVDTGFLYLHSRNQWTYSQHRRVSVWLSGDSSLLLRWGFQKNADWRSDAQDEVCIPYSLLYPLHNKDISKQETGFIEINRHLPTLFCKYWKVIFVKMAFFLGRVFFFFSFIFISWKIMTLQYCSGFCHALTWISHGFTCVPHPDPLSLLPPHPIPKMAFFKRIVIIILTFKAMFGGLSDICSFISLKALSLCLCLSHLIPKRIQETSPRIQRGDQASYSINCLVIGGEENFSQGYWHKLSFQNSAKMLVDNFLYRQSMMGLQVLWFSEIIWVFIVSQAKTSENFAPISSQNLSLQTQYS